MESEPLFNARNQFCSIDRSKEKFEIHEMVAKDDGQETFPPFKVLNTLAQVETTKR